MDDLVMVALLSRNSFPEMSFNHSGEFQISQGILLEKTYE